MPCKKKGKRHNPNKRLWIQKAIKREGALKEWIKRNERKIIGAIKESLFDKEGEIKLSALEKLRKTDFYKDLDTKTKRRINLAINLIRLARKK